MIEVTGVEVMINMRSDCEKIEWGEQEEQMGGRGLYAEGMSGGVELKVEQKW